MIRGVYRLKASVSHVLVLIKDGYQHVSMFSKLGADVYYAFPIGFYSRFSGLFNDFVSEGRVFEVFL